MQRFFFLGFLTLSCTLSYLSSASIPEKSSTHHPEMQPHYGQSHGSVPPPADALAHDDAEPGPAYLPASLDPNDEVDTRSLLVPGHCGEITSFHMGPDDKLSQPVPWINHHRTLIRFPDEHAFFIIKKMASEDYNVKVYHKSSSKPIINQNLPLSCDEFGIQPKYVSYSHGTLCIVEDRVIYRMHAQPLHQAAQGDTAEEKECVALQEALTCETIDLENIWVRSIHPAQPGEFFVINFNKDIYILKHNGTFTKLTVTFPQDLYTQIRAFAQGRYLAKSMNLQGYLNDFIHYISKMHLYGHYIVCEGTIMVEYSRCAVSESVVMILHYNPKTAQIDFYPADNTQQVVFEQASHLQARKHRVLFIGGDRKHLQCIDLSSKPLAVHKIYPQIQQASDEQIDQAVQEEIKNLTVIRHSPDHYMCCTEGTRTYNRTLFVVACSQGRSVVEQISEHNFLRFQRMFAKRIGHHIYAVLFNDFHAFGADFDRITAAMVFGLDLLAQHKEAIREVCDTMEMAMEEGILDLILAYLPRLFEQGRLLYALPVRQA